MTIQQPPRLDNPPNTDKLEVRAPNFPYGYHTDVDRLMDLQCAYSSSMFLWPETIKHGLGSNTRTKSDLQIKRDELTALEEQLRISFLQAEVLHRSWDSVQELRKRLKAERKQKMGELQELQPPSGRGASVRLPPELVLEICKHRFWDRHASWDELLKPDEKAAWGTMLYKSVRHSFEFEELRKQHRDSYPGKFPPVRVLKCSFIYLVDDFDGSVAEVLEENRWLFRERLGASFETKDLRKGRERCLRGLANCAIALPFLKTLQVSVVGGNRYETVLPVEAHECPGSQGCTRGDLDASNLKEASVPLEFLPCFSRMINGVPTLSVHLLPWKRNLKILPYYFRYLNLNHLRSLALHGAFGFGEPQSKSLRLLDGPTLVMPNLKELEIDLAAVNARALIAFLNCITATKLQTLDIRGLFWLDSVRYGDMPCAEIPEMLTLLNQKCRHIRRLSFRPSHFTDLYGRSMESEERAYKQWHLVAAKILNHMAGSPDNLILSEMKHLTIPVCAGRLGNEDFLRFLIFRRYHSLPLHTLEISISLMCIGEQEELEIERLGLHVQHVLLTDE